MEEEEYENQKEIKRLEEEQRRLAMEAQMKSESEGSRRRRKRPTTDEILDNHSNLDDQHASNNWVISGQHTESGLPLLSSDPHLGTGLPSFWVIQHLEYKQEVNGKIETHYVAGSSNPGIPLILIGRTKNVSWGITAALTDVSDLFREKIDEKEEKYLVEGEWRQLKTV